MKAKLSLLLFTVLIPIQLLIPASMILEQETVLHKGKEYKLRSQPIDPYDAFRGRYVRLGFDTTTIAVPENHRKRNTQKAYAFLDTDDQGFSFIKEIVFDTPTGTDYLRVRIGTIRNGKATVIWPFERYYMEESKAPEAEKLYRSRNDESEAYITVRIYKGTGVIAGLYIDDMRIEERINQK